MKGFVKDIEGLARANPEFRRAEAEADVEHFDGRTAE
jgi:hypothetical protein